MFFKRKNGIRQQRQKALEAEHAQRPFLISEFQARAILDAVRENVKGTLRLKYNIYSGFVTVESDLATFRKKQKIEQMRAIASDVVGDDYIDTKASSPETKRPFDFSQCRIGTP